MLRLEDRQVVLLLHALCPSVPAAMPIPFFVSSAATPRLAPLIVESSCPFLPRMGPATVAVAVLSEQVHIGLGLVPVMLGLAWAPVRLLESSTGIRCRACGRREAISAGGVVVLLLAAVLPWAV